MTDPENMWGAISSIATAAAVVIAVVGTSISLKSLKITKESAERSLKEAQKENRRQAFEVRYTSLLNQHNALHDALCQYLSSQPSFTYLDGSHYTFVSGTSLDDSPTGIETYIYFLTGHPVMLPTY